MAPSKALEVLGALAAVYKGDRCCPACDSLVVDARLKSSGHVREVTAFGAQAAGGFWYDKQAGPTHYICTMCPWEESREPEELKGTEFSYVSYDEAAEYKSAEYGR